MNWTLLAVGLFLLLFTIIGAIKGLIKILYSLIIIVVITIVTTIFAPKIASALRKNTTWDDALTKKTEAFLSDKGILIEGKDVDVNELPLPDSIKDKIAKACNDEKEGIVNEYNTRVVTSTSNVIFNSIVYIVFFLILYLISKIIGILLNIVSKLPVLNGLNRMGGAAVGLVEGLIVIWILAIFVMVLGNSKFALNIHKDIDSNAFLTFLYDKNLIMYFVTKYLI